MKVLKISLVIILGFTILAFAGYKFYKAGNQEILITMDDGVKLSTSVFVPHGRGPFPAVLVRTPYNKYSEEWLGKAFNIFRVAVVLQDTRGKYRSEGKFYPFINEREDGLATLRWIRSQPWSDGRVAGYGGSYVGYTQWAISDSLDFMTLLLTGSRIYDLTYPDSLFSLQTAFLWGTDNASDKLNKIDSARRAKAILTLPVTLADDSAIKDIDFFNDWIIHDRFDDYWKQMDFRGKSKAPVLSIAGWYDLFLNTQIADFQALGSKDDPKSRLIIGPLAHGSPGEPNEYGGLKKTGKPTAIFKYLRRVIKGRNGVLSSPFHDKRYNLFIMELNEYIGSDVWPPAETEIKKYYLGPENVIAPKPFEMSGSLSYTYDPANPFPNLGGTTLGKGAGPSRQNPNVGRTDQILFEMAVANEPLILLGPVSATLWLSSSAECTDFIVGIQDVFPDGKIINIQEGGARLKFGDDSKKQAEISIWATGYQLNPGHRLRVVISSGWFPRYNRSLNNCEPAATAATMNEAVQTLWYGPDTPSSVNLPVYTIP
jgi:hypothetical protein